MSEINDGMFEPLLNTQPEAEHAEELKVHAAITAQPSEWQSRLRNEWEVYKRNRAEHIAHPENAMIVNAPAEEFFKMVIAGGKTPSYREIAVKRARASDATEQQIEEQYGPDKSDWARIIEPDESGTR